MDPPVSSGFFQQVVGVAAPLGANTIVVVQQVYHLKCRCLFVPLTSAQATSQMVLIEDLNNLTGNILLG